MSIAEVAAKLFDACHVRHDKVEEESRVGDVARMLQALQSKVLSRWMVATMVEVEGKPGLHHLVVRNEQGVVLSAAHESPIELIDLISKSFDALYGGMK